MNNIQQILEELNFQNGSNYKISVLSKYKGNDTLARVLKMTYDLVTHTYGITPKSISYEHKSESISLKEALDILEDGFCTRQYTGNAAINKINEVLSMMCPTDANIIIKVLNRDLRINVGKTQINKVFNGLITKPTYMRCEVFSKKTAKNIKFPAILEVKSDGTYREVTVSNGNVMFQSRSGERYEYPLLEKSFKKFPDGSYTGELTVNGITDRQEANGLINSLNPPHEDIIIELWDYILHEDVSKAGKKNKSDPPTTPYNQRFFSLLEIMEKCDSPNIKAIPFKIVDTLKDAVLQTSEWMKLGYEGSILKDLSGVYKDGTSKHQLKLKLEISAEMRCTGFKDGKVGTKREGKVGSILFENDEGTIKGKCSGFNDEQLDYFTENKEEFIGKILEVQFNDITQAKQNDFYALSHPRFIEWRNDKDETDTLEKVFQLKQMAMELMYDQD